MLAGRMVENRLGSIWVGFLASPIELATLAVSAEKGSAINHTHVKVSFKGKLTDPRKILCKEFGF
jgi:hypothetical protein